jgi:Tfp pilus assembly protein PilF
MNWMMRSVLLLAFVSLALESQAQSIRYHIVSGRLMFDHISPSCDRVKVELEVVEMQAIDTAFVDSNCGFRFHRVATGFYILHVNIDGFEEVRLPIEVSNSGLPGSLFVQMVQSRRLLRERSTNGYIRDVSEIMEQFPRKAVDLYEKSVKNRKKKKNDLALEQLEQALKIAPNFYQARNDLGMMYKQAGRLDEAEEQFVQAHELNHNNPDPLINLSALYLDQDKFERAVEVSQEAVQKNGRSAPALFNLGVALYKLSKYEKAEVALRRAMEVAPRMYQTHLALANVYLKQQKFDSLVEQLDLYLKENPNGEERDQVLRLREQVMKAKSAGV